VAAEFGKAKASGTVLGTDISAEARVWGWGLAGTGTLPLSREFDLFGKLGVFHGIVESNAKWWWRYGLRERTLEHRDGRRRSEMEFLAGNWGARVEWERIKQNRRLH